MNATTLSYLIALLFLTVQWLGLAHRIEHRSAIGQATSATGFAASSADAWGHEKSEPDCKLYDALTIADAAPSANFPVFQAIAFSALFLTFLSALVFLRAYRANARAPPRSI